jgi:hypothetical protein
MPTDPQVRQTAITRTRQPIVPHALHVIDGQPRTRRHLLDDARQAAIASLTTPRQLVR